MDIEQLIALTHALGVLSSHYMEVNDARNYCRVIAHQLRVSTLLKDEGFCVLHLNGYEV